MRLLIVEDEPTLAKLLANSFTHQGWAVDSAPTLQLGKQALAAIKYDCVLLDLGLPDGSGSALLRHLRKSGDTTPVLVITANDELSDKLQFLDDGADDYLVKPFDTEELAARIRAVLRRHNGAAGRMVSFGNIVFDEVTRNVAVMGQTAIIPRRETAVLEVLLRRAGRVVSRASLDQAIYNWDEAVGPNAIEAHVSRLRKRLGDMGATVQIQTVRGMGYLLMEARS